MKHIHPQFLSHETSQLLIIDIQEKLFSIMHKSHQENILKNVPVLLEAATELDLPVVVSEQYPKGIGSTIEEINQHLEKVQKIEKIDFAATEVSRFTNNIVENNRRNIILTGMESHICVYQTALGLRKLGFEVHIVSDAIATRLEHNQNIALDLMKRAGCYITSTETVLFQLLERAGSESFKKLQKLIL